MQTAFARVGMSPKYPPITPWNPSRRAVARVKTPLPPPTKCRFCAAKVEVVNNSEVYGKSYGDWPWVYRCLSCKAYVGMHQFTDIPLGTLADAATRDARRRAHAAFDPLWQGGSMSRTEAYGWLAAHLGIAFAACHISWFDSEMCDRVVAIVRKEMRS